MAKIVSKAKLMYFNFERPLALVFSVLALTMMIVSTVIMISFIETQLGITAGGFGQTKAIPDAILRLSGVKSETLEKEQYLAFLGSATGVIAVLVTLWFAIVEMIKGRLHRIDLIESATIKKHPVYNKGDDLKVMLNFYRGAEEIVVYSGDFDWIGENEDLKNQILKMAEQGKITLVSYKSKEKVKNALEKNLFDSLSKNFHFSSEVNSKCSLIKKRNSTDNFLYLTEADRLGNTYVCAIYGEGDSRPLLNSISAMSSKYLKYN